ncbi:hypothetical protein [Roseibium album]|uniref:hypothetical protein n=1 Tax=Roseibium album TaxID=311410 RepID=UPI003BAFA7C6
MKKYDVVAGVGTYQDRSTGETKYINKNVGAIIQTEKGFRLCLDATFNPAGMKRGDDGKVWLSLFEPRPREQRQGQTNQDQGSEDQQGGYGGSAGPMDDEIPF